MPKGYKAGGRAKGTPNKATADVREVIAAFAKANAELMHEKLNAIDDPAKWMDSYLRAIEYHIPKAPRLLGLSGPDGGPLSVSLTIDLGGQNESQDTERLDSAKRAAAANDLPPHGAAESAGTGAEDQAERDAGADRSAEAGEDL